MKYDTLVIGGGLAGLTAGIRCGEAGLNVAVVSTGESALAFSSGSVDVLGMNADTGQTIRHPFQALESLTERHPEHPYAAIGSQNVNRAMDWFRGQVAEAGQALITADNEAENHWRLTAAGALRPTWLSQPTSGMLPWDISPLRRVVFASFTGFLDFMPELAVAGLKTCQAFENVRVSSLNINLSLEHGCGSTADTMRAPQLARAIGESDVDLIASVLLEKVGDADLVAMPACLSCGRQNWLDILRKRTGLNIVEVATLPPSVHGIDLLSRLRNRLTALGGFYVPALPVQDGIVEDGRVISVRSADDTMLYADHFILASGSFFSKGLHSQQQRVSEPVFGLDLAVPGEFSEKTFIAGRGHGFNRAGVTFNEQLQPSVKGLTVSNLYVAGAVLAGSDPVKEGSGGGVAVSSGWHAAEAVIKKVGCK